MLVLSLYIEDKRKKKNIIWKEEYKLNTQFSELSLAFHCESTWRARAAWEYQCEN